MIKINLKIIKGVILILIGFLLFYADYKFMSNRYNEYYFNEQGWGLNLQYYIDQYITFWHILVYILFISLGIIEIGGAFIDGN